MTNKQKKNLIYYNNVINNIFYENKQLYKDKKSILSEEMGYELKNKFTKSNQF